jgi:hypothetical protein
VHELADRCQKAADRRPSPLADGMSDTAYLMDGVAASSQTETTRLQNSRDGERRSRSRDGASISTRDGKTDRSPDGRGKLLPRAGVAREGAVEAKTAIASTTPRAEIYAAADGVYQVGKYTKWI